MSTTPIITGTSPISLRELVRIAAKACSGDSNPTHAWDHYLTDDGEDIIGETGDSLVDFVLTQLENIVDPGLPRAGVLESAAQALETAIEELTDIKNALHAAPSYNEGPEGVRVCATFVPEAWQNNNAVEVDPEGETEIDITAEVLAMGKEKALQLKDKSLDVDAFQHAAMVPKWIKNWHGPFSIHVEDSIAEYFEAIEQQGKGEQA